MLFAYLASYPLLQSLRHPEQKFYWLRWAAGYGLVAALFGIPLLLVRPQLLWLVPLALATFVVNAWFARQRNERNLLNDLAAMAGLNLTAVAGYVTGRGRWDAEAWILWAVCLLYFFGTALHVKSLLRERRNRLMKSLAVAYALVMPAVLALVLQPLLAVAHLPATLRAMAIPQEHRLKSIVLGVIEIVCSLWFCVWIIITCRSLWG